MRNIRAADKKVRKQKSEGAKAWWASKTPEQRSRIWKRRAKKAWETKRKNSV